MDVEIWMQEMVQEMAWCKRCGNYVLPQGEGYCPQCNDFVG